MRLSFKHSVGDFAPPESTRKIDSKGFLHCTGVKMSRGDQVLKYHKFEFAGLPDDAVKGDYLNIYFPADELLSEQTILSFEAKDVTDRHPDGNEVNSATWADYSAGTVSNVRADNGFLVGDFSIKDAKTITKIQSNTAKQVSIGYSAVLDLTAGVAPDGAVYDGVWRDIQGDHVAVVEFGRAGAEVSIGDKGGKTMKIVIDGLPFEVADNEALQVAIQKQEDKLNTLSKAEITIGDTKFGINELPAVQAVADTLIAENTQLKTKVTELSTKQIGDADIDALVCARAKLIADAKELLPTVVTDGKANNDIVAQVVAAHSKDPMVASIIGDGLDPAMMATAFKALSAVKAQVTITAADVAFNGDTTGTKTLKTRDQRKADAWKESK
jgi:hypothetical protein